MTREEFIDLLDDEGYSFSLSLGGNVIVNHRGSVDLYSLKTLPPGVVFKNGGRVYLRSLETIPLGVEFKNGGYVDMPLLVDVFFEYWNGNIEGVDNKRVLNLMISKGMFI